MFAEKQFKEWKIDSLKQPNCTMRKVDTWRKIKPHMCGTSVDARTDQIHLEES